MPNKLNQLTVNFINNILVRCEEIGTDEVLKEYESLMKNRKISTELIGCLPYMLITVLIGLLGIPPFTSDFDKYNKDIYKVLEMSIKTDSSVYIVTLLLALYISFEYVSISKLRIAPLNQFGLISNILKYIKSYKIGEELAFDIKGTDENAMIENMSRGICLGLSQIFLHCAFISDMQDERNSTQEHDLDWFYKHILLLQFPPESLPPKSQNDLVNFISLTLYLQGAAIGADSLDKAHQSDNFLNMEFTGKHKIEWSDAKTCKTLDELFEMFSTKQQPCYFSIIFSCGLFLLGTHAICIHKTKDGKYRYYDPNSSFFDINLSTKADLEQFIRHHLVPYSASDPKEDLRKTLFSFNMRVQIGKPVLKPGKSNRL